MSEEDYYSKADKAEQEAQLASRNNVIKKSFVTDLWIKVLHRAIDDIVMYFIEREKGTKLKQEDLEIEQSAYDLLFDDDYRIIIDDYQIVITCNGCKDTHIRHMSEATNTLKLICPLCNHHIIKKETEYYILEHQQIKEISLVELLSMWDIHDIKQFRVGARKRIALLIKNKKKAAENRKQAKLKRKVDMAKTTKADNFQPATNEQLTDFDKGVIKQLDDIKEMLMKKNRKYGNSATNPIRAFSNADPVEQIKVRIDDKISRLVRSTSNNDDEDVVKDLTGYLVILAALQKGYIK